MFYVSHTAWRLLEELIEIKSIVSTESYVGPGATHHSKPVVVEGKTHTTRKWSDDDARFLATEGGTSLSNRRVGLSARGYTQAGAFMFGHEIPAGCELSVSFDRRTGLVGVPHELGASLPAQIDRPRGAR